MPRFRTFLRLAGIAATGYSIYQRHREKKARENAESADRSDGGANFALGQRGDATSSATKSSPKTGGKWTKRDEALDESFPASDPPASW